MMSQSRVLHVLMNGVLIGRLEKSKNASLSFIYDSSWLNTAGARPISLSMPLIDQTFTGDLVYNFFDNLLPDNQQIRARIQTKFRVATNQPFDLLAQIGKDCVGAVQIIEGNIPKFKEQINFQPLNEKEVANILSHSQDYPLGMQNQEDEFRVSLAGMQEKAAFLFYRNKWSKPLGSTPTSHIFKLPMGYIQHQNIDLTDSCENEWLCSQIAAAFGLPVAASEVLQFEKVKVLAVERFDRRMSSDKTWLMRLPQEDICQALGISSNLKYQADGGPGIADIMRLLLGSKRAIEDRDTFFRSQILFWLLAAIDGHAKNFSLFIESEGKYHLTPLYDILSMYPLIAKKQLQPQKIKMAMALEGKNKHYHWHSLQRRYFLETAKTVNYSAERAEQILDEMLQQVDAVIEQVSLKLPDEFPKQISTTIFLGMRAAKKKLI